MNLIALALRAYVPVRLKRQRLRSLFEATAEALHADVPELDHLSFDVCLQKYAAFTKDEVEKRLRSGEDLREVGNALYQHAYGLGEDLRKRLHLRSRSDVLSVGRALYRAIGIDFEGSRTGAVVIRSCVFSRHYSAAVCHVMSSLDEGVAAGLSAGGRLSFSKRITEGASCCEAFLDFEGGNR